MAFVIGFDLIDFGWKRIEGNGGWEFHVKPLVRHETKSLPIFG